MTEPERQPAPADGVALSAGAEIPTECAERIWAWALSLLPDARLPWPNRFLARHVAIDLLAPFVRGAASLDEPIDPAEACRLFLEQNDATESEHILAIGQRAETAPRAGRMFFGSLLDLHARPQARQGMMSSLARFTRVMGLGALGWAGVAAPLSGGRLRWRDFDRWREAREFRVVDTAFAAFLGGRHASYEAALADTPVIQGPEEAPRAANLSDASRHEALLYALLAVETASSLERDSPPDERGTREACEKLAERFGPGAALDAVCRSNPVFREVLRSWFEHKRSVPTMFLRFGPIPY